MKYVLFSVFSENMILVHHRLLWKMCGFFLHLCVVILECVYRYPNVQWGSYVDAQLLQISVNLTFYSVLTLLTTSVFWVFNGPLCVNSTSLWGVSRKPSPPVSQPVIALIKWNDSTISNYTSSTGFPKWLNHCLLKFGNFD